jgi:tRNA(Ile)-lysidine synthase
MRARTESVAAVARAIAAMPPGRWLLAVSGGLDSMVLLDSMAAARAPEVAAVATFDHGTGEAAKQAVALVDREAEDRGLPVVSGSAAASTPRTEADWRAARFKFLNGWARELDAVIITAHTRDYQIETVVQRLLRDAGPRGLAGMSRGTRPLLSLSRPVIEAYARNRRVPFIEDPSNATLDYQRNRVRHEILAALERASPGFGDWCWSLAERAADWRAGLVAFVDGLGPRLTGPHTLAVPSTSLESLGPQEWEVLWPELAVRAGIVMERQGIARAAAWAPGAKPGSAIPLAGGGRIERTLATFVVRGAPRRATDGRPFPMERRPA